MNYNMAYNNRNKLKYWKQVQDEVQVYFVPGVTTYSGIFNKYIVQKFPMCYSTFMNIMSKPIEKMIKENEKNAKK